MNRRAFIGSVSVVSAVALGHRSMLAAVPTRLDQVRARFGIAGPIVLRGFFYLGCCPISLDDSTTIHSLVGGSVSLGVVGCVRTKEIAHDVLQAIAVDQFANLSEARRRYGLTFDRSGSPGRSALILGRDNARSFRERLAKCFDDTRLELPGRNAAP